MADQLNSTKNFKEGLKGASLFGGVQVFKIIIAILRSKVLAVFLGPQGVGVLGLLSSTLDLIYSISNFGLATSAVREISEAYKDGNLARLTRVSKVFKKLVWVTGIIGLSICLFLSPYWSYASFGNHDYIFTFALLSLTVLFRLLSEGQNALLQGTYNLRLMAKSNVWGNALGLIFSIPCYYFWGIAGIGPSLFLIYLINLLLSWFYSNKVKLEKITVSLKETLTEGKSMLKLGFFISLSGLLTTGAAYIIRLFISNQGGLDDVGLYTAGFAIVNTYVGMIFTAMGTEYFPRLASFSQNKEEFSLAINQQMQISILLTAPLICTFVVFSDIGINILYSSDFLGINIMVRLAILAIVFKAPSWCCSYAIIAKGDSILFFWTEFASLIVMLVANISLYYLFGLNGLGMAFVIIYLYYMLQEWVVCKKRYGLKLSKDVVKTYLPHIILCLLSFVVVLLCANVYRYIIGLIPIMLSIIFSLKQLNKVVNIKEVIKSRMK